MAEHAELFFHLRAAGDEDERALRRFEQEAEMLKLGEEQQSGVGGEKVRHRIGGRVRAMRGAEGVVT